MQEHANTGNVKSEVVTKRVNSFLWSLPYDRLLFTSKITSTIKWKDTKSAFSSAYVHWGIFQRRGFLFASLNKALVIFLEMDVRSVPQVCLCALAYILPGQKLAAVSLICRECFYRSSSTSFIVSLCCRSFMFRTIYTYENIFIWIQSVLLKCSLQWFPLTRLWSILQGGVRVCNLGSSEVKHFFKLCSNSGEL